MVARGVERRFTQEIVATSAHETRTLGADFAGLPRLVGRGEGGSGQRGKYSGFLRFSGVNIIIYPVSAAISIHHN